MREEDPETVSFVVDGDPTTTAWSSEHYDTDTFAGTKTGENPGFGLYVTAKSTSRPAEMIAKTPTPGWDAQIFTAASGPTEERHEADRLSNRPARARLSTLAEPRPPN